MASENKRLFNVSECVSDRSGVVVFVRKDGEYYCSDSFHEALKEIFNTRATVEYIDHDNNYKSVRVDASVDADKQNITLHIPAEFGSTEKALRLTYNIEGTFTAEEIACGSGSNMVEKVLFDGQLQFAANPAMEGAFAAGAPNAGFQFEDGKTYNIVIGDTANNVKAKTVNSATLPVPVVLAGNASFMNMGGDNFEDTGESFVAMVMPVDEGVPEVMRGVLQVISTEVTAGDYAVKITTMEEKASGGGMFVVNATPTGIATATLDKTYQEIQTAYDLGAWVVLKVVGAPMLLTLQTPVAGMPALFAHYMPAPDGTITFSTLTVSPDDTVEIASYIVTATKPK